MKIADFGISKRFKDTVLKTHAGSHAYMAPELPELLGLLPRELMDTTYTKAVDIWSLGCLVHEVLTTEIPFLEMISADSSGIEQEDSGLQRTDFTNFKSFCDGKTEFPLYSLRRSGASDSAVQFLKTLLVADPKCRPLAKEALLSKWLPQGADTRSLAGDRAAAPVRRVVEGMIATPSTVILDRISSLLHRGFRVECLPTRTPQPEAPGTPRSWPGLIASNTGHSQVY